MLADVAHATKHEGPSTHGRMALFDIVRGFSVISMVLFHLCYDLRYIYGHPLAFFQPPFQDIWRASISWTFLFIAGCMCSFSRNGLRRSFKYLTVAAIVFATTTIVAVDTPISFGIIFCMGASTLIEHLLDRAGLAPKGYMAAFAFVVAFLLLLGIPHGYVGIGEATFTLPQWLYAHRALSFLGFPGPGFASGDYYPLLPFSLMYLAGAAAGRQWRQNGYPSWTYDICCPPLQLVGRHALPIYVLHQPILIGLLELMR